MGTGRPARNFSAGSSSTAESSSTGHVRAACPALQGVAVASPHRQGRQAQCWVRRAFPRRSKAGPAPEMLVVVRAFPTSTCRAPSAHQGGPSAIAGVARSARRPLRHPPSTHQGRPSTSWSGDTPRSIHCLRPRSTSGSGELAWATHRPHTWLCGHAARRKQAATLKRRHRALPLRADESDASRAGTVICGQQQIPHLP